MKIGDSYNFENNQIRIILFDDKEVFYQTINDDNSFVYSNYRTINYYRTSLKHFYENSHFIEISMMELESQKSCLVQK